MVGSGHFTLDTPSVSNHALKKVKLWDKVRALEVLARHFGVLKASTWTPREMGTLMSEGS